jgi:hypothetical protein
MPDRGPFRPEDGRRSGLEVSHARVRSAPDPGRVEERPDRQPDVLGKLRPGRKQGLEVGIEEREYAKQNAKTSSLHFDSCDATFLSSRLLCLSVRRGAFRLRI